MVPRKRQDEVEGNGLSTTGGSISSSASLDDIYSSVQWPRSNGSTHTKVEGLDDLGLNCRSHFRRCDQRDSRFDTRLHVKISVCSEMQ